MPMPLLVQAFGDGVGYSASSQVAAILAGRVGLVRQDMVGSAAWPSDAEAGHRDLAEYALELGTVAVVSRGQDDGEGPASSVGGKVDFGREAAAGPSQTFAAWRTSSNRAASFCSTGSTWFVPRPAPF